MTWTIDEREAEALRRFMDAFLPEFEYDLARIKLQSGRHDLVVQDELLRALRGRLDTPAEAAIIPH